MSAITFGGYCSRIRHERPHGYSMYEVPGSRVSCARLAWLLDYTDHTGKGAKNLRAQCEAYGRNVICYVHSDTATLTNAIAKALIDGNVKFDYQANLDKEGVWQGYGRFHVYVTYFKAWHWDE